MSTKSEYENIKNLMRTKAVENAKVRAVALTKPLNQTLGLAIHITDGENYDTNGMLEGKLSGVVVAGYGRKSDNPEELPNIEFKKIKVATNINVKFILK
jgi:hypothetical protein